MPDSKSEPFKNDIAIQVKQNKDHLLYFPCRSRNYIFRKKYILKLDINFSANAKKKNINLLVCDESNFITKASA